MSGSIDSSMIQVPVDLEGAGAYINGVAEAVTEELQRLRTQLTPIADGGWTGGASTYYNGLQSEWDIAAEGLLGPDGVLGQIANAMHVTWQNYSAAEWANTQTWQHS
jgi:WXG100 family type VII secretion target